MRDKNYYLNLRNSNLPDCLKIVFILESPPASGKYFYDEDGSLSEPLFAAMMKLLNLDPQNKKEGLKCFADSGYLIVDATYEPVNRIKGKARDIKILENYDNLISDLSSLGDPRQIQFVVIKANVCRLLEPRLIDEGFNVINNGVIIPFPSTGQQKNFQTAMKKVLTT